MRGDIRFLRAIVEIPIFSASSASLIGVSEREERIFNSRDTPLFNKSAFSLLEIKSTIFSSAGRYSSEDTFPYKLIPAVKREIINDILIRVII